MNVFHALNPITAKLPGGSRWRSVWLLAAALLLFILASFFHVNKLRTANYSDANWQTGISLQTRAGILIDVFPRQKNLAVGDSLRFAASGTRHITEIVKSNAPYWEIWLDGAPLDFAKDATPQRIIHASPLKAPFGFSPHSSW